MNLWHFCCLFRRTNTGCAPLLHYLILSPKIQSAMTGLVRYVVLWSLCCLLVPLSFWLFDSLYLKLAQTSKESSLSYIWETKEKGRAKRQKKNDKKEKEGGMDRKTNDLASESCCWWWTILYCISPHNLTLNSDHFSLSFWHRIVSPWHRYIYKERKKKFALWKYI